MAVTDYYQSPVGRLILISDGECLTDLCFDDGRYVNMSDSRKDSVTEKTRRWLDIYFSGKEPDFTPPLAPHGSAFGKEVWDILLTVPYGQTVSYGYIADIIAKRRGCEKMSSQAVGGAVGRNPIAIIIPCHRIIGKNGSLTGYGGGLERKEFLLSLEAKK